jgi:hypothetical protein
VRLLAPCALAAILLAAPPAAAESWLAALGLGDAPPLAAGAEATAEARFLAEGHAAIEAGDVAAARRSFEAALAANPDSAEALAYLGLIHEGAGHWAQAEAMYLRVLALAATRAAAGGDDGEAWSRAAALAADRLEAMAPPDPVAPDERASAIARFATLAELASLGLVEATDAEARRAANLGALLPATGRAPSPLVFRAPPSTEAIADRLTTLDAFRARGVLADEAYAREREAILDALLPLEVREARPLDPAPAPPLDELVRAGLVTRAEAEAERVARGGVAAEPLGEDLAAAALVDPAPPPLPSPKPARAEAEPAPAPPAAAPPPATGSVGLHLASYRTPEQAELGWTDLVARNGDVLGDLFPRIAEVDRGADTGVYFEVRAGPLPDMAAALAACDALIARGLYCATTAF